MCTTSSHKLKYARTGYLLSLYIGGQEHRVGQLNPITSQTDFSKENLEKLSGETKSSYGTCTLCAMHILSYTIVVNTRNMSI